MAKSEKARAHDDLLDWLAAGVRAELWQELNLDEPLEPADLWEWALALSRTQDFKGERLAIRLPRPVGALPENGVATYRSGPGVFARPPYYRDARGPFWIEAFSGRYLDDDPNAWPPPSRWPFHRRGIQPLALVALAATAVQEYTGCSPEYATLFLLCDVRFGQPGLHASVSSPGGLHLWFPDAYVTAEELAKAYASARQSAGLSRRARSVSSHTGNLIRLVDEMRPEGGAKTPWREVLAQWNAAQPAHTYVDPASIATAYRAAAKRRMGRGLLPKREKTHPDAEESQ